MEAQRKTWPDILCIRDCPSRIPAAARWFHEKWGIPEDAYRESMESSLEARAVPRWYVAVEGERIVGGLGVIENDFHPRTDLSPNVCAVYVEPDRRRRGMAGALLQRVCRDMAELGVDRLYLLTDHEAFYERYGWEYLCPVRGDGEKTDSRIYTRRTGA